MSKTADETIREVRELFWDWIYRLYGPEAGGMIRVFSDAEGGRWECLRELREVLGEDTTIANMQRRIEEMRVKQQ